LHSPFKRAWEKATSPERAMFVARKKMARPGHKDRTYGRGGLVAVGGGQFFRNNLRRHFSAVRCQLCSCWLLRTRRVLGLSGPRRRAKSGASSPSCPRGHGADQGRHRRRRAPRDASPRRSPDTRRAGRGSCPTPAGAITAGLRCSLLQVRRGLALVLRGKDTRSAQGTTAFRWVHASWGNVSSSVSSGVRRTGRDDVGGRALATTRR
jgi:hypothetical protein